MKAQMKGISLMIILLMLVLTVQAAALRGTVTDKATKEPLIGAAVQLSGTNTGTITDVDGNFELAGLRNGTYKLIISYVSYCTQIVEVTINGMFEIKVELEQDNQQLGEVVVVADAKKNTENAIITQQRTSLVMQTGVSAQQITKTQDKDASEVIRRVSGISIIEEKFVMVRGLSQRYNNVWINNSAVPSSEADARAFSFDIIPSSQLDNMLVVKSPAPEYPADFSGGFILVTAIVGMIGIRPTIAGIEAGKDIALANKETLVTAGHLIIPLAKKCKVRILPVDSEHSAIFQALNGEESRRIHKLLVTASGGPFRGKKREELENVQVEDALKHPNWSMGQKITIDSATLVNKGLEVMEAKWLFGVPVEQIQVVVQPQSVIHSMVEFEDGAVMAQLGTADMRLPIQYALYGGERRFLDGERLDFAALKSITFEEPDMKTFRGLPLAIKASKIGGSMPTVFNAANEKAVGMFLKKQIRFLDIYSIIEETMQTHTVIERPDVETITELEQDVYRQIGGRW